MDFFSFENVSTCPNVKCQMKRVDGKVIAGVNLKPLNT